MVVVEVAWRVRAYAERVAVEAAEGIGIPALAVHASAVVADIRPMTTC